MAQAAETMTAPANSTLFMAAATLWASIAAVCDVRTRRIPNQLTLTVLLSALVLHLVSEGAAGAVDSLSAAAIAGAAFFVPFFMGAMGGGDVKLMAAIAAFGGLGRLAELMLATALSGGVLALVVAFRHGYLRTMLIRLANYCCAVFRISGLPLGVDPAPQRKLFLPYGVAIAAGSLVTFWMGVMKP